MPVHHVVLASGAVVAVSVAVATALAMYENPELRRYADDIRRRVAMALHSLGNGINPPERAPRFNRPEDAEGFLHSSRGAGAEPGVDADEETRRRQRDELMYWNSLLLQKKQDEEGGGNVDENATRDIIPLASLPPAQQMSQPRSGTPGSTTTFDDFLMRDESAEQGTYIVSTGADVRDRRAGLRHRGAVAAAASSMLANPFADENYVDSDELADMPAAMMASGKEDSNSSSRKQDNMSDIYSATTREDADDVQSRTLDDSPALIEVSSPQLPSPPPPPPSTLERQLAADEYMTASQEDGHEAYASIQAWAHDSSRNFYSPLPETPSGSGPVSEPDVLSEGQLTPTDSVSVIGSSEVDLTRNGTQQDDAQRPFDVMSASEGFMTPVSWSDVGSVVSENDAHAHVSE
ncbi:hypothetical protein E4U43_006572 [Claviceps pusilla]|uniref:Uncharacterized protein n=1 Tax=Claviceps pusilla TaxID=123648 RepID=A0A9P7STH1_9HYPO|nr:hypothetical protein E4U43_006572 [Claviceps pusilla]